MKHNFEADRIRNIGPRVKELLDANNIRAKDAAAYLNLEISYYYRLLRGDRPMTIDHIIAHSELLDVSIFYIIFGMEVRDVVNDKTIEAGEINSVIDMTLAATMKLDDEDRKEKMLKILNVLDILMRSI